MPTLIGCIAKHLCGLRIQTAPGHLAPNLQGSSRRSTPGATPARLPELVCVKEDLHTSRTMTISKACGALSTEMYQVLHILWHDSFTIFDKLACQRVCKTWRGWLRHLTLVRELQIDFDNEFHHTHLSIQYRVPTISVGQEEPPSKSLDACCSWLISTVDRIQRIQLQGHDPLMWQLQQVLSVLQSKVLQGQPKIELILLAGALA